MSKWLNSEIDFLKQNYTVLTDKEISKSLGTHSKSAVESQRHKLHLGKPQNAAKYGFHDVIKEFSKTQYILLSTEDEYKNCNSKMRYVCTKHKDKGVQNISLNHLRNGQGCYYCSLEKQGSLRRVSLVDDKYKTLCESKNFTYVDTIRKNGKIIIQFICDRHKEFGLQEMTYNNMRRNIRGCKYCSNKNLPVQYVLDKAKHINPYIHILEPYKNLTTPIKCYCSKHNQYTTKTMQSILKGSGCCYCGQEKVSAQHILSLQEFTQQVKQYNSNIDVLEYNGKLFKAKLKCKVCGYEWESSAAYISSNKKLCPNCEHYYLGEKMIADYLDNHNITYVRQYKFADCKDKKPLLFDFYLPAKNMCIEYDGRQHYQQINGWTLLSIIQHHDKIKNDYCKNHNIRLLRIPYWKQNNIDKILKNYV